MASRIDLSDLTPEWKQKFIGEHLPWKISQLRAYTKYGMLDNAAHKVGAALDLSTCVAGRMLLEFLGVGLDRETLGKREPKGHDIWIKHFGIDPLDPKKHIDQTARRVLVEFLHRGNKIAHVTYDFRMEKQGKRDGHQSIRDAVPTIERLMVEHFYTPLGESLRDLDDLEILKRITAP